MTATRQFSTKRLRGSRMAEPSEGSLGLPRFLGKAPGIAPFLSRWLVVRLLPYIHLWRPFRNVQCVQELLGRQHGTPGPARRVLDLPVGAHDGRSASKLARQPHELVVGRQGWPREDHPDTAGRRSSPGEPRSVEHDRELVLNSPASPCDQVKESPPSRTEALDFMPL